MQNHQFSERKRDRRWPETSLLVPTSCLLCDLEQVTFLLWAGFLPYKVRLWAKSLWDYGIMRDIFFFFMTLLPFQICYDVYGVIAKKKN